MTTDSVPSHPAVNLVLVTRQIEDLREAMQRLKSSGSSNVTLIKQLESIREVMRRMKASDTATLDEVTVKKLTKVVKK